MFSFVQMYPVIYNVWCDSGICGGNQKEWKWVLSFTKVACIVAQGCKQTNETEPLMDNILGGSNSYYYHI